MNKRFLIVGIVLVIGLAGAVYYFTSRRPVSSNLGGSVTRGQVFQTWADYLASGVSKSTSPRKVVFVGVDGSAWNIIDPLIEEGLLPTFARLKAEGSYGVLRSTDCYVSPPAWATMMTGYLPEHNGVYTFGIWDTDRQEFVNISAEDIKVPSIWDAASVVGRRTAVVNVPVTYPVREVNGIMVSGLLTPASLDERQAIQVEFRPAQGQGVPLSYSPVLHASFDYTATRVGLYLRDTRDDGRPQYDTVLMELSEIDGAGKTTTREYPLGQFSPWVEITHERDGKRQDAWCRFFVLPTRQEGVFTVGRSRVFFDVGDTDVEFTYPPALQATLKKQFNHYFPSKFLDSGIVPEFTQESTEYASFLYNSDDWDLFLYVFTQTDNIQHLDGVTDITRWVYKTIDKYLQNLIEILPEDAVLIIGSDHGFTEYVYSIDLNKLLEQMGLLEYKNGTDIDYDKTLVFHNLWNLYFNDALLNKDELDARGIPVATGQPPRAALIDFLERAKPSFHLPDGQPITVELFRFPDTKLENAPDMIVKGTYSNYMVEFWNLQRPRETIVRNLRRDEAWNHTREGIYLFYGDGIKRGYAGPVENIQDMAPTMLYLLGVPLAENMDGRVIHSIFSSRDLARGTFPVITDYNQIYAGASSVEEREALEEKLRSLGYIR